MTDPCQKCYESPRFCTCKGGAPRCKKSIEKEWKGHAAVLSRNQCRNKTRHPSGKCHLHRPSNWNHD